MTLIVEGLSASGNLCEASLAAGIGYDSADRRDYLKSVASGEVMVRCFVLSSVRMVCVCSSGVVHIHLRR